MAGTIQTATLADALWVASRLRRADRVELGLEDQDEIDLVLYRAWECSTWAKAVLVDGIPAIIYGVSPTDRMVEGSVWMLATDRIGLIRREFVAQCRGEVEKMLATYPYIHNNVHAGNREALRWLRWLGFTVDPAPTGRNNEFLHFWKEV